MLKHIKQKIDSFFSHVGTILCCMSSICRLSLWNKSTFVRVRLWGCKKKIKHFFIRQKCLWTFPFCLWIWHCFSHFCCCHVKTCILVGWYLFVACENNPCIQRDMLLIMVGDTVPVLSLYIYSMWNWQSCTHGAACSVILFVCGVSDQTLIIEGI